MSEAQSEALRNESGDPGIATETGGSFRFIWFFLLLLLAYPLSIGPVYRFYKGQNPPSAIMAIYLPIEPLYHTRTGRKVFDWYFNLWEGR